MEGESILNKIADSPESFEKGTLLWLGITLIPAGLGLAANKDTLLAGLALIVIGSISVFIREFRKL